MDTKRFGTIEGNFSDLIDPRKERTKRHELLDIVSIAISGVICGADNWVDIELFGNSKQEWLKQYLSLPNGIPSHDTFGRVFSRLDPDKFRECFMDWVREVSELTKGEVVAIDGKTLRRSHDKATGKSAIHMVSAWASTNQLVMGQTKVDDKSNEITAIPKLLRMLELSGCIVTIDAMGCQKEIAKQIIDGGADYVLSLKENHGHLYEDVQDVFESAHKIGFEDIKYDFCESVNGGHGRIETRRCWSISDIEQLACIASCAAWKGLKSVVMVTSEREVGEDVSVENRYYISSLKSDAQKLLGATRTHWEIENCVHWILDVAFDEDDSRVRTGNAPENLSIMRHMALNLLKRETTSKGGVKARRKRAGWDEDYLVKVLSQ